MATFVQEIRRKILFLSILSHLAIECNITKVVDVVYLAKIVLKKSFFP